MSVFHVMTLSKFASSSTLEDIATLHSDLSHPSLLFKFPHRVSLGRRRLLNTLVSRHGFLSGSGYTMKEIVTWYFVIIVL